MASGPVTSWQIQGGEVETVTDFLFLGSKITGLVTVSMGLKNTCSLEGLPDSSDGKESACNAGDPSSIPGSGRSPGERIGYPLQYSGLENSMD